MKFGKLSPLVVIGLSVSCVAPASETGTASEAASRPSPTARKGRPISLVAGGHHVCVLDVGGVHCWGENAHGETDVPALEHPTSVSAGDRHTCAIDESGVRCWGDNQYGQTNVPALRHPTAVTAGDATTCTIDDDGVHCWGFGDFGQNDVPALRRPTQLSVDFDDNCAVDDDGVHCWGEDAAGETVVPPLRHPTQVASGDFDTCAIDDDGVHCWGSNDYGQTSVPTTLRHPTQVSAGFTHTCALDDGGLHCWGSNRNGETDVPALSYPTQVATGVRFTCAVADDEVHCWGESGVGTTTVPNDLELVGRHSCFVANGRARCVGRNELGQLGVGRDADLIVPVAQASATDLGDGFESVSKVAVGLAFSCALGSGGAVKCWGRNPSGQLGLGDTRDRGAGAGEMGNALPPLSFGGSQAGMTELAVGENHACALGAQNEVFCWGRGSSGQLGTEATDNVGTTGGPARAHLDAELRVSDLALGASHSCLLTAGGSVYCFGQNDAGQLGLGRSGNVGDRPGTMGAAMQPVMLGDGFSVKSLASGRDHVCALSHAGSVKCWGANDVGQLGLGDTRARGADANDMGASLPTVDLGHGQVAVDLACGSRHCCVRMIQNTMMCWGDNSFGQLGLGDRLARGVSPASMGDNLPFVMTPPGERVMSIRLDADRTCARTETGLRCWGRNRSGELGFGDQNDRGGSPATIPRLLSPLGI